MTETDLKLKAIDAVFQLRKAANNVYPENPILTEAIERLYAHLLETLKQDDPSIFADIEKKLHSGKDIINRNENETINGLSLLEVLLGLDIRDIVFERDTESEVIRLSISLTANNSMPVPEAVAGVGSDEEEKEPDTLEPVGEAEAEESLQMAADIPEGKPTQHAIKSADEYSAGNAQPETIDYLTLEQDQIVETGPVGAKNEILENISVVEKIFARLNAMEGAIEAIPSDEQMDMIRNISRQASDWVRDKTALTPEYKETCLRLQALIGEFISNGYYAAAVPIINVFGKISAGALEKNEKIRALAAEILRGVASDNNVNTLFKEINRNDKNKKPEAGQIFAALGDMVLNKLLTALRNASDSKVRISIIHIIQEMGQSALPAVQASINTYAPWYYLRNMAYILGRIGDENSVETLKPLLLHSEKRVRTEAFKSVCQIGGKERGPMLLSVLPEVDNEMRMNIIELFGKIKYEEAVPDMQDMLKSKTSMSRGEQTAMQEKICLALGSIGSLEAIKILTDVAESKSFLGLTSYPTEVRYAAKRALEYLKRK